MTPRLLGGEDGNVVDQQRARAHQTHVALYDVPELGQLVEAGRTQNSTKPGEPLRIGQQSPARIAPIRHRSELDEEEWFSTSTWTSLPEQGRRSQKDPHQQPRDGYHRREDDEHRQRTRNIHGPLQCIVSSHRDRHPKGPAQPCTRESQNGLN